MNYGQRTCVLVVGMHRSGTSALAGVLRILGVSFGDQLITSWEDNPKGYFENASILQANIAFLESYGVDRDGLLSELPVDWLTHEQTRVFKDRLKEIITSQFSDTYIFGIKDPRIALLLPVYIEVLQELNITVRIVASVRDVASVAASLVKRNGLLLSQGVRMHEAYYRSIRSIEDVVPATYVSYDDLLHRTQDVVMQLGKAVHPTLRPYAEVEQELATYLDPSLQHHRSDIHRVLLDLAVQTERLEEDVKRLRHVREQDLLWWQERIDTMALLARDQQALLQDAHETQVEVRELEQAITLLQRTHEQFKHKVHQDHESSERHRVHLEQTLAERDAHITALNTTIANIERSTVWKIVKGWDTALALLLPRDTFIRRGYDAFIRWNQKVLNEWLPHRVLRILRRAQKTTTTEDAVKTFWHTFAKQHPETDILFINHEESRTGAPRIVFDVAEHMRTRASVAMVSLESGSLRNVFEEMFSCVIHPQELYPHERTFEQATKILKQVNPKLVYVNSIDSHVYARAAKALGIPVVLHVHELAIAFQIVFSKRERSQLNELADAFIAVSQPVYDLLVHQFGCDSEKVHLVHAFVNRERIAEASDVVPVTSVLQELKKEPHEVLVVCIGMFIYRKGADIFMRLAKRLQEQGLQCRFVWIGSRPFKEPFMADFNQYAPHFSLIQEKENPFPYIKAADIFVLPSREDPFPLVALEALSLGKPIVAFKEAGGIAEAIEDAGIIIDTFDEDAFADAVTSLVVNADQRSALGARGPLRQLPYDSTHALPRIEAIIQKTVASRA